VLDDRFGRLSGVVKFLFADPQSTKAWAVGSEGERLLAERLQSLVGDRAVLLHDRRVPRKTSNIDHIAIAASGVWVIDAKKYKGVVHQRDVGRFFKIDNRLYVGSRDCTRLADGVQRQIDVVRIALDDDDIPIFGSLCFIDAEWKLFAKPFRQNDVWVSGPRRLAEMIAEPGSLEQSDVLAIAGRLASSLPAAVTTR
jgi:hypothetical protein